MVHPWDGSGYPVDLRCNSFGENVALERYYDFELACFRREVPPGFWHLVENCQRYNNVHTYVRVKRFGETVEQAVSHMNLFSGSREAGR